MGLKQTTPPAVEPITTDEAKTHGRITTASDDTDIAELIKAARQDIEEASGLCMIHSTWTWKFDQFPQNGGPLIVPRSPLVSVTTIKYQDVDDVQQTWADTNYIVDDYAVPGRITLDYEATYPSARNETNSIEVIFVAGYTDTAADVPPYLRHAMRQLVAYRYVQRDRGAWPKSVLDLIRLRSVNLVH